MMDEVVTRKVYELRERDYNGQPGTALHLTLCYKPDGSLWDARVSSVEDDGGPVQLGIVDVGVFRRYSKLLARVADIVDSEKYGGRVQTGGG